MNESQLTRIKDVFAHNESLKQSFEDADIKAVAELSRLANVSQTTIINNLKTLQKL